MSSGGGGTYFINVSATLTAAGSLVVPAGYQIQFITFDETANHAVTGGLMAGTTLAGTDIITAQAVLANTITVVPDATVSKRAFSLTVDQTVYIDAVTDWNGASVNVTLLLSAFI